MGKKPYADPPRPSAPEKTILPARHRNGTSRNQPTPAASGVFQQAKPPARSRQIAPISADTGIWRRQADRIRRHLAATGMDPGCRGIPHLYPPDTDPSPAPYRTETAPTSTLCRPLHQHQADPRSTPGRGRTDARSNCKFAEFARGCRRWPLSLPPITGVLGMRKGARRFSSHVDGCRSLPPGRPAWRPSVRHATMTAVIVAPMPATPHAALAQTAMVVHAARNARRSPNGRRRCSRISTRCA